MNRSASIVALLHLLVWGCNDPAAQPPATPKPAPPSSPSDSTGGEEAAKQLLTQLEELEKEARDAVEKQNWTGGRQAIRKGLELAKTSSAFDINKASFLLEMGNIERQQGREGEARRYYADAMAIFHVHKNAEGRFRTYLALGQLELRLGDYPAATRQFKEANTLLAELDKPTFPGVYKMHIGHLASRQLKHAEAQKDFIEAYEIFEAANDKNTMAELLLLLAKEDDAQDQIPACRRRLESALRFFRELKNLDGEARTLHKMAALLEREQKFRQSRKILVKVHELYKTLDLTAAALAVQRHIDALPEETKDKKN